MTSPVAHDNQLLRTLCSLPAVRLSPSTALEVPELPPRERVTGDEQVDAVLWLRTVIRTGQQPLIDKAMEAAKLITTPLKDLEKRYTDYVQRASNGHFGAILATFGFADLQGLAETSVQKLGRQQEAVARFGSIEKLFAETPAEKACKKALSGMRRSGQFATYNSEHVANRFMGTHDLAPTTLADCLHVQQYWDDLYWLRHAADNNASDHLPQAQAHDDFAFGLMQRLAPRTATEAMGVLEHMVAKEEMDRDESVAILRNLIGGAMHPLQ